jgi:sodium transport system ATP-binding protein
MLKVKDLRKSFGAVRAVDSVSFEAADGHITGLLGANGAGKTTTLSLVLPLLWAAAARLEREPVVLGR